MVFSENLKVLCPGMPAIVVERIATKIERIVAADIVEYQRRQRVAVEDFLAEYDQPCHEPRDGQQQAGAEAEVEIDPDAGRSWARTPDPDSTDHAPRSEAAPDEMDKELPGAKKINATSAWENLTKEERSTQMRLRWVKRRQNNSRPLFVRLQEQASRNFFDSEQNKLFSIISLSMNHASSAHESDSAMKMAVKIYHKAPYKYRFYFNDIIESWGNIV